MKKKGIKVSILNHKYFLIFEEDGFYFKSLKKNITDLFIPYNLINDWEGTCLEDKYLFKLKYFTLYKIYAILAAIFVFMNFSFSLYFFAILFFFVITGYLLFKKITQINIYADFEKIPVVVNDNRKLCLIKKELEKHIQLSKKDRLKFYLHYKQKQFKESFFIEKKGKTDENSENDSSQSNENMDNRGTKTN